MKLINETLILAEGTQTLKGIFFIVIQEQNQEQQSILCVLNTLIFPVYSSNLSYLKPVIWTKQPSYPLGNIESHC